MYANLWYSNIRYACIWCICTHCILYACIWCICTHCVLYARIWCICTHRVLYAHIWCIYTHIFSAISVKNTLEKGRSGQSPDTHVEPIHCVMNTDILWIMVCTMHRHTNDTHRKTQACLIYAICDILIHWHVLCILICDILIHLLKCAMMCVSVCVCVCVCVCVWVWSWQYDIMLLIETLKTYIFRNIKNFHLDSVHMLNIPLYHQL